MIIRTMGIVDVPAVIPMLFAAYGRPVRNTAALERSLRRPGHYALVAVEDEEMLGTVGIEIYGSVAYIGGMGVAPRAQRRGIGTALLVRILADAGARGVRTFLLDATAVGEPLYRAHGFVGAGGVALWERVEQGNGALREMPAITAATLEEVVALDAAAFGAARGALLADYADEARGGVFRVRSADGYLAATAFVRETIVGPWSAYAPRAAAAALDLALAGTASRIRTVFVPDENESAASILAERGFSRGRRLAHMRLGDSHPVERGRIYGQASLGTG